MKAASHIKTPEQYIASLPADRRETIQAIHDAIVAAAPDLTPHICSGMLGYGPYHYRSPSGCEGDWFVAGLASQKNYISLYVCGGDENGYVAEQNKERLGKVSVGRSCIRFKKLEDLQLKVALQLIKKAAKQLKKKTGGFMM